jgi:hypothetical protein
MKIDDIISRLISAYPGVGTFDFNGRCSVCGKKMVLTIYLRNTGEPGQIECQIAGGAGFGFDIENPNVFSSMKCGTCYEKHGETEVWSRIVGYMRPVKNWNPAKQAEFKKRAMFKGFHS